MIPGPLAEEGDVVIAGLGLDTEEGRQIVLGLRERHPDTPLCSSACPTDARWGTGPLWECETVVFPWITRKVHEAVARAVAIRQPHPV